MKQSTKDKALDAYIVVGLTAWACFIAVVIINTPW